MKYDAPTILIGVLMLLIFSFLAILLVTYLYLLLFDRNKVNKISKLFLVSGFMSLAWLAATALAIWTTASFHVIAFVVVSSILLFAASYLLATRFFELSKRDLLIYGAVSAIAFNPGWLVLIGIL
jgi:hypothetical protein